MSSSSERSQDRRPRSRQLGALGFGAIALGCAAVAALLAGKLMNEKGWSRSRVRPVVVAKRTLPAAQPFTIDDVTVVNFPEESVPPGAVGDPGVLFQEGRTPVPTTGVLEGEPIVPARLAGAAMGTGLAAMVRKGHRAVAIKVDEAVGRSGLVYPGAYVDVLATIRDPEGRGPSTRIAVEDVRVLAVEAETDVTARRPRARDDGLTAAPPVMNTVVTIEVTPEESEIVSLATREGQVDLALRNGSDREQVDTRGATPIAFSAFAPEPAPEAPAIQISSPALEASPPRTRKAAPRRRGIEIRASDDPDVSPTAGIETYHAR